MTPRLIAVLSALVLGAMTLAGCTSGGPAGGAAAVDAGGEGERVPIAGAVDAACFRVPGARALETAFSPLNWPTPTEARLGSGAPGPGYWQQQVDYQINAVLDADKRAIVGTARVTYTNNSPHQLDYLWLHLEQNLFKADSDGALTSEPESRFGHRKDFEGGITIQSIRAGKQALAYHVYDTIARVELPRPIAAATPGRRVVLPAADGGEQVVDEGVLPAMGDGVTPIRRANQFVFDVSWSFTIPPFGADRMGIKEVKDGVILQVAQWFPAVAVYDDVHGWNTLPYLGAGEFYTNFGNYDVSITVPNGRVVAATGVLQNPDEVLTAAQRERLARAYTSEKPVVIISEDEAGTPASRPEGDMPRTWRFRADMVRTFAWACSNVFLWDASFLADSGPAGPDGKPLGTLAQSFYPREALPLWRDKATDMLRFSIDHYNKKWFRYPYPVASNINGVVGGMEYPMIIFCAEQKDEHGLYGVTTHEIGHNWFPMVVSTDERRHAWMDEGFDTFINVYSAEAYFGKRDEEDGPGRYVKGQRRGQQQPMMTEPDFNWRGRLGFLQYGKPAMALVQLRENVLGPERFDAAFREYISRWAFKGPQPEDFFRSMEDAAGADLSWFWRGWFYETGLLDQAVVGFDREEDGSAVTATFANLGEMVMPTTYRVTYTDGSTEDRRLPVQVWATTNRWVARWPVEGGRTIKKIVIDPDARLPDINRSNNQYPR